MTIPEKYQDSIGPHGFPIQIKNMENIVGLAVSQARYLQGKQVDIAAAFAKPLMGRANTVVRLNGRGAMYVPAEVGAFVIMQALLSNVGKESGLANVGFLAEEADETKAAREAKKANKVTRAKPSDAYWVIDPICKIYDYIHGGKDWSLSIGFAVAGVPTGGVIVYPNKNEVIYTTDGGWSESMNLKDRSLSPIRAVSHDVQLRNNAGRGVLVAEFARQMKVPYQFLNPDVYSNVALQAIASRVSNQDSVVTPELPKQIVAPQ